MSTNNIILAKGTSNELPQNIKDGSLLFSIDDGRIYIGSGGLTVQFYKKDLDTLKTYIDDLVGNIETLLSEV